MFFYKNAQKAIRGTYNESYSYEYGVGIIKVIGRESGFLAVEASIASRDVHICLIPEIGYELYGKEGLLNFVINRVKVRHYCIIVVAEGAGKSIIFNDKTNLKLKILGDSLLDDVLPDIGVDESGNSKPGVK